MKLPHHFTGQFGNPMDAAQESGTWGDEGKAVERRGALTVLLFEQTLVALCILTWIKERECDPMFGITKPRRSQTRRGRSSSTSE